MESLSWAKEYNSELEKQQSNLGQIHHMYSHIYLLSEKGLVFYLYLQKFHMDFSLSRVIFAMANFDKRKFVFETPCMLLGSMPRSIVPLAIFTSTSQAKLKNANLMKRLLLWQKGGEHVSQIEGNLFREESAIFYWL